MKDVVHRHAASPLSHLRPGEQNNKVSQPPEACRRKLDHLYAISTSSPPLGGVFIVAYFCGQYNQEVRFRPQRSCFRRKQALQMPFAFTPPPVKKSPGKIRRFSRGINLKSFFRCNNDDRRQRRKQGGVVGAAASKTRVPPKARCGCWVPQPGRRGSHFKSSSTRCP